MMQLWCSRTMPLYARCRGINGHARSASGAIETGQMQELGQEHVMDSRLAFSTATMMLRL